MTHTILVVDDQANVRRMLQDYLSAEGFRVVTANDGQMALYVSRSEKPDLVLLDIMMPGLDGYGFMRSFRKEQETPVILLTARMDESDKVMGLELGADDYVTKPFGMRELLARIRAVLRRAGRELRPAEILRDGDLMLDHTSHMVTIRDDIINLTPSEFDLLAIFLGAPGRVFTRADLLERLQGSVFQGVERTIDVHIRNLRSKIEPDSAHPIYIETVFGVGYRLGSNTIGESGS